MSATGGSQPEKVPPYVSYWWQPAREGATVCQLLVAAREGATLLLQLALTHTPGTRMREKLLLGQYAHTFSPAFTVVLNTSFYSTYVGEDLKPVHHNFCFIESQ